MTINGATEVLEAVSDGPRDGSRIEPNGNGKAARAALGSELEARSVSAWSAMEGATTAAS